MHKSRKYLNFATVIELERHIEILLLDNDCVIVPDFGGFMAHHVSARYDETDGSFLPPIRTLGFNPQLKINDSLLIHSYIEAYSISYPEASQRVNDEVNELKKQLQEKGFYELNNIGTLSVNLEGNIEFAPNEAGILTPDYYGLCSFEMKPVKAEVIEQLELPPVVQEEKKNEPIEQNVLAIDESNDDEAKTISIRVAWIRNAVAIAAAILAFFLITTPVSNSINPQMAYSSIQPSVAIDTAPITTEEPASVVEKTDTMQQQEKEIAQVTEPVATPQPTETSQTAYVVVLASQVSKVNAENFVKLLHQQGYNDARIHVHNKITRVIVGHFANQGAAYEMVNKLRDHEEYDQAWVMKVED